MHTNTTTTVSYVRATRKFIKFCSDERGLSGKTVYAYGSDLAGLAGNLTAKERADVTAIGRGRVLRLTESLKLKYKPRTTRRKLAVLKSFFSHLEREGSIKRSPFHGLRVRVQVPDNLPRCIRLDSVAAMARAVSRCGPGVNTEELRYRESLRACVFNMLLFTGIRVSELVGLSLGGVDADSGTVVVMGKGNRERMVPITDALAVAAIRKYIKRRAATFPGLSGMDSAFFVGPNGKRVSDQSARAAVRSMAALAGVEDRITPHMFRHTFASLLSGAGVDIRAIQQVLGHRSILTTQIYAHVSRDDQREILRKAELRKRVSAHR